MKLTHLFFTVIFLFLAREAIGCETPKENTKPDQKKQSPFKKVGNASPLKDSTAANLNTAAAGAAPSCARQLFDEPPKLDQVDVKQAAESAAAKPVLRQLTLMVPEKDRGTAFFKPIENGRIATPEAAEKARLKAQAMAVSTLASIERVRPQSPEYWDYATAAFQKRDSEKLLALINRTQSPQDQLKIITLAALSLEDQ